MDTALCLSHMISFLFLSLEKVSLKYLFWSFVLNYLYSRFLSHQKYRHSLLSFPQKTLWITENHKFLSSEEQKQCKGQSEKEDMDF